MKNTAFGALTLALGLAAGPSCFADDEKVPIDKLPAPVVKALNDRFPGAKLGEAVKEVEDGKTIFEVELVHKDSEYSVGLKPDGTIEEIEREVEIKALPDTVKAALMAKYPKAKLKEAVEVVEGPKPHTFEVIVARKGKKSIEVVLDAKGMILSKAKVDDDDDDDDDDKGKKKED